MYSSAPQGPAACDLLWGTKIRDTDLAVAFLSESFPATHAGALADSDGEGGEEEEGGHGTERGGTGRLNVGKRTTHGRPRRGPATDAGGGRGGDPRVPPALALPPPPPPIWTAWGGLEGVSSGSVLPAAQRRSC